MLQEAERERKLKERKLQKEAEAQRKKELKAAHAEEIKRKKLELDDQKRQKNTKVVETVSNAVFTNISLTV